MPGRTSPDSGSKYRYGFNGKENDNEVKGAGNEIDYGMRVYDPRVGRFLSVDPLQKKYPWYTPYQFSGNTPIQAVDLDGREEVHFYTYDGKLSAVNVVRSGNAQADRTKLNELYAGGQFFWGKDDNSQTLQDAIADLNLYGAFWDLGNSDRVKGWSLEDLANDYHNFLNGIAEDGKALQQAWMINSPETQLQNAELGMLSFADMAAPGQVTAAPLTVEENTSQPSAAAHDGNNAATSSNTALPSTSPRFNPNKPALANEPNSVSASSNGYAPDFTGHPDLYPVSGSQKNIVKISMTGSYSGDFSAANQAAGLGSKTPKGYTWHHLDDYNSSTGEATLQLIKTSTHQKTIPHTGAVKQYEVAHSTTYGQ